MKKAYPIKTVYYKTAKDALEGTSLPERKLASDYKYIKTNPFARILSAFLYRCIATPAAYIHSWLFMRDKIIGKEKIKPYKKRGCFIYGNHTHPTADAFMPGIIAFPRRAYTVVSRRNLSLPVLGPATSYLGGLPLPDSTRNAAKLSAAVRALIEKGQTVCIYPEAELWSYCPFVRPFNEESFSFPARLDAPVFCFTRVYKRSRLGIRSQVYIDGPYFSDTALSAAERRKQLCDTVFSIMQQRLQLSDVEVIKYEPIPPANPESTEK